MNINGQEVSQADLDRALKDVFDSIAKGRFAAVMRAASLVETVARHAFRLDEEIERIRSTPHA